MDQSKESCPPWLQDAYAARAKCRLTDDEIATKAILLGAPTPRKFEQSRSMVEWSIASSPELVYGPDKSGEGKKYYKSALLGPTEVMVYFRWMQEYYPEMLKNST